jgi:hypothetical protein
LCTVTYGLSTEGKQDKNYKRREIKRKLEKGRKNGREKK